MTGAVGAPGRRIRARSAAATSLALVMLALPGAAQAQDGPVPPGVQADASLVVDADSGTAITAENPHQRLSIASATKLMTALLTLEGARPDDVFTAAGYEPDPVESQIGLQDGERMEVRDLLVALLLESANDAAVTLAQGVEGDTGAFVQEMNIRADRLGLDDTSYANPIGFDHPRNYSSADDLARLARHLMEDEDFRDIVEEPSLELETGDVPRTVENRNTLVEHPLVDGVKTGHTLEAGYVLVGSAENSGNRVISVVLGASSEAARDQESLELLLYGLGQFVERRLVREGEPVAEATMADADDDRVELTAARSASVTILRGDRVERRIDAPAEVEGPLPAGAQVGTIELVRGGETLRRVPLVTSARVPAPDLLTRVATTLGDHLWVVAGVAVALCGVLVLVAARVRRARTRPKAPSAT